MPNYTQKQWLEKVDLANWLCYYCGRDLFLHSFDPGAELTKDHLVPKSRGGLDILCNIVPACWRCNRMKQKRTAVEFILARPGLCSFARSAIHKSTVTFFISRTDVETTTMPAIIQQVATAEELRGISVSAWSAVRELARLKSFESASQSSDYFKERRRLLKEQAAQLSLNFDPPKKPAYAEACTAILKAKGE